MSRAANAPLHILQVHMNYVAKFNSFCFDLLDKPRMPVEPATRKTKQLRLLIDVQEVEVGGDVEPQYTSSRSQTTTSSMLLTHLLRHSSLWRAR